MEVTRRYAGSSQTTRENGEERLSFSPDLLREPTFFVGQVSNHVNFREAISTLHHVVTSDLRFQPKDRTEYMAWLDTQRDVWLAEAASQGAGAAEKLKAAREELGAINARSASLLKPFRQARGRYWKWLWHVNRDAWWVLDPVIAVSPDEISFECFSTDESTYGRLSCDLEMFDEIDEVANGVTNIDYSYTLYEAFQQVRSYRRTELRIEPGGFTASTDMGQEVFEQKIDLPDSWVRGFLQVSSAMALPAHRVRLHPMDIHNLCFALKSKKERRSPRSLRFNLKPGQPPEMIFEPWEKRIPCPRAVYHGGEEVEIRMWGRRRLLILERLIPIARSFDLYLLGNGMPAFVVADLGPMSFTLGLSGWTANDWSRAGQFDLLAPRRRIGQETREKVFSALSSRWLANEQEIATETGFERSEVSSALTILAQHGRAMYDLDKKIWRYRDVVREPLDFEAMRFQSDERLVNAHCGCDFHRMNALRKGPCEHILAVRRLTAEGDLPSTIIRGPWEGGK